MKKGVLSNFLTFAHKKHLKWQKVITHRLLRCHPRFPAETGRERCVSTGEGQEHPRQNYNNLAPGLIASALGSSASATKKEERHSGLPVSSCKILLGERSSGNKNTNCLMAGGLWREKSDKDRQGLKPESQTAEWGKDKRITQSRSPGITNRRRAGPSSGKRRLWRQKRSPREDAG